MAGCQASIRIRGLCSPEASTNSSHGMARLPAIPGSRSDRNIQRATARPPDEANIVHSHPLPRGTHSDWRDCQSVHAHPCVSKASVLKANALVGGKRRHGAQRSLSRPPWRSNSYCATKFRRRRSWRDRSVLDRLLKTHTSFNNDEWRIIPSSLISRRPVARRHGHRMRHISSTAGIFDLKT